MDGRISERRDRDGLMRWKGEMRYRSGSKITILRFKLQVILPPQVIADSYLARVDFIQQQGNRIMRNVFKPFKYWLIIPFVKVTVLL
jgi:hypothetical protein